MFAGLLHTFTSDAKVQALVLLVVLDLILGCTAALVKGTFRLAFVADFLRNDILGKIVPYFALWAAVHVGGDVNLPGTSFGLLEEGAFGIAAAALTGSLLSSLRDLGLLRGVSSKLAGGERPPAP